MTHNDMENNGGKAAEESDLPIPVLVMMLGRGRVGKTGTANALVQFYRALGCNIQVWNADQQNESHSLSRFHKDVLEPRLGSSFEDRKRWLEARIQDQSQLRYDAVIDFAGGDPTVPKLAQEVRLLRMLKRMGIRPVTMHIVGPEKADLDYLRQVVAAGVFVPESTVIVMNGGLVQGGRSAQYAFDDIISDPVVVETTKDGAVVAMMPELPCMSGVMDLGISFVDAANNRFRPGQVPLSFFDQERTAIWWDEELPKFFCGLPPLWMPRMPTGEA